MKLLSCEASSCRACRNLMQIKTEVKHVHPKTMRVDNWPSDVAASTGSMNNVKILIVAKKHATTSYTAECIQVLLQMG